MSFFLKSINFLALPFSVKPPKSNPLIESRRDLREYRQFTVNHDRLSWLPSSSRICTVKSMANSPVKKYGKDSRFVLCGQISGKQNNIHLSQNRTIYLSL